MIFKQRKQRDNCKFEENKLLFKQTRSIAKKMEKRSFGAGTAPQGSETKQKPVYKLQAGSISLAVWPQELERDDHSKKVFYNVSLQRTYRDKDGNLQNSNTIPASEAESVAKLYHIIFEKYGIQEVENK